MTPSLETLRPFADESNKIEGMGPATIVEVEALHDFLDDPMVTAQALELYVGAVAPGHVLRKHVGLNVRVGSHIAPAGGPEIYDRLHDRLMNRRQWTPYQNHLWYENLHPFTDGNGRSGRALWLYEMLERGLGSGLTIGFLHSFYYQTLEAQDSRK
jgi:hypothetical protein